MPSVSKLEGRPWGAYTHRVVAVAFAALAVAACSTSGSTHREARAVTTVPAKSAVKGKRRPITTRPYKVGGKTYVPREDKDYRAVGLASWYGPGFYGRRTASGETFSKLALTAAHPTLPLPSYVRVTNVSNGKSLMVRVNDRGPFAHSRIIDLSSRAADLLGVKRTGVAKVEVEYVGLAPEDGDDTSLLLASFKDGAAGDPAPTLAYGEPQADAIDRLATEAATGLEADDAPTIAAFATGPSVEGFSALR